MIPAKQKPAWVNQFLACYLYKRPLRNKIAAALLCLCPEFGNIHMGAGKTSQRHQDPREASGDRIHQLLSHTTQSRKPKGDSPASVWSLMRWCYCHSVHSQTHLIWPGKQEKQPHSSAKERKPWSSDLHQLRAGFLQKAGLEVMHSTGLPSFWQVFSCQSCWN